MKNLLSSRLLVAGLTTTVALSALSPARAVELQPRFVAGQSLSYDLMLSGTANLKVPSDAPMFFAGVPLEIEVQGNGLGRFNTLDVDALGNGTVFFELPKFDLNGQAFGQKAKLELREGKEPRFLLNGKPLAVGGKKDDKTDKAKAPDKRYGLVIGKDGRIKNVKELAPLEPVGAPAPTEREVAGDEAVSPEAAIDQSAFMGSIILRSLPTLWPKGDVQVGDTWETELAFPAAFAKNAAAAEDAPPLSQWTMTLKGQETVDGVELWRVGVVGGVRVDGSRLAPPATPKKNAKPVPQLDNLTQNVNGDLWFDALNGRIMRGEFVLDARGQSHTIDNKGRNSDPSWADFTGTFGMKLREVGR